MHLASSVPGVVELMLTEATEDFRKADKRRGPLAGTSALQPRRVLKYCHCKTSL